MPPAKPRPSDSTLRDGPPYNPAFEARISLATVRDPPATIWPARPFEFLLRRSSTNLGTDDSLRVSSAACSSLCFSFGLLPLHGDLLIRSPIAIECCVVASELLPALDDDVDVLRVEF